jgi:MFS family permease
MAQPGGASNQRDSFLRGETAQSLYELLTNEEDARACSDISDAACRVTPGNFLLILCTNCLTKLGDALISPKTVLAWLASSLGAPAFVLALLVPIRESGSLVPQLAIGSLVRRFAVRKWIWVAGSLLQGVAVLAMGWIALILSGAEAGWALLLALVLFSLSRGLCSVAAKDVLGKTVPRGRRGQLTGWSASIAGIISLGVGVVFLIPLLDAGDKLVLSILLLLAAALWFGAAIVFSLIREEPGATEGGRNAFAESFASLNLLVRDAPFRRFVIARSLLMCSALSAPFYVALAQQQAGSGGSQLGAFILAGGAASLISAPVWGRFADRSSRSVMTVAASLTAGIGGLIFFAGELEAEVLGMLWALPMAYFVLSVAHSGVRVGRKTYVVDLADGNRRTDYVSVSNSVIGVLLLIAGLVGLLADQMGNHGVIGLLSLLGACGAFMSRTLKDV